MKNWQWGLAGVFTWVVVTMLIQAFYNPKLTPTELILNIPRSVSLQFAPRLPSHKEYVANKAKQVEEYYIVKWTLCYDDYNKIFVSRDSADKFAAEIKHVREIYMLEGRIKVNVEKFKN